MRKEDSGMNTVSRSAMALIAAALFGSCTSVGNSDRNSGNAQGSAPKTDGQFYVQTVFPQGELSSDAVFPSIQIQFSEPVVALKKLGEPSSTSNAVTITPAVNGVFRWYGTSLLSFDCSDKLIPQKEYTIRINQNLTSITGQQISGQLEYTFRTQELALRSIQPGYTARKQNRLYLDPQDILPEYARDISVTFGNKVNGAVVSKYLSVVEQKTKKVHPFTFEQLDEKTLLLHVTDSLSRDCEINVVLAKGAVPDTDCIATSAEQKKSFHTLKPFKNTYTSGTSTLCISFNHRIKEGTENQIFNALSFSPAMELTVENVEIHGNTIFVHDLPVTYGDKYSVKLAAKSVSDIYDQICADAVSYSVTVPDADSYASYRDGSFVILESQFEPNRAFEFQNITGDSSYTLTAISGVTDSYKSTKTKTFKIATTKETKNRRVIQTVALKDFLEQVGTSYRGAVKFQSSAFYYPYEGAKKTEHNDTVSYIQVTDLGVQVRHAWNGTAVMVSSLTDGSAVSNATVNVYKLPGREHYTERNENMLRGKGTKITSGVTDKDGLASLTFDDTERREYVYYLEVKTADDRIVLPLEVNYSQGRNVTHIFSDRKLYRPGEDVSVKVIDRLMSVGGDYSTYTGSYELNLVDNAWSSKRKVYASAAGTTSAQGTASADWTLPNDLTPGTYYVEYKRTDGSGYKSNETIMIQYFERVRFSASAEVTPVVYVRGDTVTAEVTASYLGGGSLAGGTVHADWTRDKTSFAPAGEQFEGYTFGPLAYDWYWRNAEEYENFYEQSDETLSTEGKAHLSVATGSEKTEGAPYFYNLEAQVTDAGNQMIAARAGTIVHPALFYIGVSSATNVKGFAKKGEALSFDYLFATPEGNAASLSDFSKDRTVTWTLQRKEWQEVPYTDDYGYEQFKWEEKTIDEQTGSITVKDASKKATLTVTPKESGRYLLIMQTTDSRGNIVKTERSFYVTGAENVWWRNDDQGHEITLEADKTEYNPGETATILLNSTLSKGRYLVTVERNGILSQEVVTLDSPSSTLSIPIKESYVPQVYVSVQTIAPRDGEVAADYDTRDTHKPQAVYGMIGLDVSTKTRTFDVTVSQDRKTYRPGSNATLTLSASQNGKPVANAELTLMVIDRGVLDLIGYRAGNPVDVFYNRGLFGAGGINCDMLGYLVDPVTYGTYSLPAKERMLYYATNRLMYKSAAMADGVMLEESMAMDYESAAPMAAMGATAENDSDESVQLQVRNDFRAKAVFLPSVITDANGKAVTTFKLPDSLTEYVVTVVGVKEQTYAYTEDTLTVANPVSVRDVETRILRPGDKGEAGVVITNIGDETAKVTVSFDVYSGLDKTNYTRAEGELIRQPGKAAVSGTKQKTVTVASGQTQTLMFTVDAESAGWITLAFKVNSAEVNEVIYKALEIEKPYVYETVTTVGQLGADETKSEERIVFPLGTDDGKGSFYIQLDATRLGTLSSAVDYVFHYPYGCMEQRSSAVLPLISFGEYISVFGLNSEVENCNEVVEKELKEWAKIQRKDGGFPYWPDGDESSLAVSLRIAEILALAKEHNMRIPSGLNVDKLASYIQSEIKKLKEEKYVYCYPEAYAYYVLTRLGKKVAMSDIEAIISKDTGISEYAFAGLAALAMNNRKLADTAAIKIKNFMALTARGVSFQTETPWSSWYFFNGDSERYALALHLFTKLNAEDIYNGHLVYQILQLQNAGKGWWKSTATTSRVLIALEAYIKTNNLENTNLTAEVLLNGSRILDGTFKGVASQPVEQTLDFATLSQNKVPFETEVPLVVQKEGDGQLFYTASLKYALPAEEQKARDEGLCVYVEIEDARTGQRVEPGKLKSGVIYRERVYVTTTKERTFVALRAPVPAGAQILNAAFVTTATIPQTENNTASNRNSYWWRSRMSHQDVYDAEIRCFWNYMGIGNQSFEFLFRADRTGTYQTPAVIAECMYESEVFGRSDGCVWTIE